MSANRDDSDDATGSNGANDSDNGSGDNGSGGGDKKPPGLSTTEMLWILLAIAAVMLISRGIQNLF